MCVTVCHLGVADCVDMCVTVCHLCVTLFVTFACCRWRGHVCHCVSLVCVAGCVDVCVTVCHLCVLQVVWTCVSLFVTCVCCRWCGCVCYRHSQWEHNSSHAAQTVQVTCSHGVVGELAAGRMGALCV